MKFSTPFFTLLLFVFISSCSKNDQNDNNDNFNVASFNSQLCTNVSGPKAVLWDLLNGIAVPLNFVPLLENINGQFIHSQLPYLGFPMPAGYSATEIYDPNTQAIGVNVIRNDNNAVWRYLPTITFSGNVSPTDIIAFEINQVMNFHNANVAPQVICTETRTIPNGQIVTNFTARLITFENFSATVFVQTLYFSDLNVTFASISLNSGLSNEYDTLILDTFLPLYWQLLVGPEGVQDSDLDGYPDSQDAAPFDPNVH